MVIVIVVVPAFFFPPLQFSVTVNILASSYFVYIVSCSHSHHLAFFLWFLFFVFYTTLGTCDPKEAIERLFSFNLFIWPLYFVMLVSIPE